MHNRIYTGTNVKAIDQLAISDFGFIGLELMKKAGERAFLNIQQRYPDASSMLVLCGSGNNGGDGYVVAKCAISAGWKVSVVSINPPNTQDALTVFEHYINAGGSLTPVEKFLHQDITTDVLVDALLGVGISGAPRSIYAQVIIRSNQLSASRVAIDVPSGVDADAGNVFTPHINADFTISFIAAKLGLMTGPALNAVGSMVIEDLAVPSEIKNKIPHSATLVEKPQLLTRDKDSHKGRYGHVVVAGGDDGMFGAVLLAGQAALRSGSGKVHILSTAGHQDQGALVRPELMSEVFNPLENTPPAVLLAADVIALGPGLGMNDWGKQLFDLVLVANKPLVVDADALTLLAESKPPIKRENWILTPHPGEAARLLGCTTALIQADRLGAVKAISHNYGGVCVLKGAGTLIANHDEPVGLCIAGNPGMATAGMGDVLAGIIASLLGQGYDLLPAAQAGVWIHATTADRVVETSSQASLIASDIIAQLSATFAPLEFK